MLQDDEQTCENLRKASSKKIAEKQREVDKQSESIEALKEKVAALKKKSAFYNQNFDQKAVTIAPNSPPATSDGKGGLDPLTSWLRESDLGAEEDRIVNGLRQLIMAGQQSSHLDLSNLVEQLKKFELHMNELFELRRILQGSQYQKRVKNEEFLNFEARKELQRKQIIQEQITKKKNEEQAREKKNAEREGNIQKSGKRVKHRSEKKKLITNTKVKVEIDPEEADMRLYLEFSLEQGEFMPPPKD